MYIFEVTLLLLEWKSRSFGYFIQHALVAGSHDGSMRRPQ